MTMGEGGAVYTNNPLLHRIIRSVRDWGRDCMSGSGQDNLCNRRFDRQYRQMPFGYDYKYIYSHLGYNLKITEMQAAVGCAQLEKIESFIARRRKNFEYLKRGLAVAEESYILPEPCESSEPSWFGFLITCKNGLSRDKVVHFLEENNIKTRMLFGGNMVKQPCFQHLVEGNNYRIVGNLRETDRIMTDSFWVGLYPGMTKEMLDYMIQKLIEVSDGV